MFAALPQQLCAAPYAAMVVDARDGRVIHSRNADTRLHPASLTKMMTLYIAFEAVERGEISLDTKVRISKHAASEPPSKLGLVAGQRIKLRYLIRAAAVKSANDAATAIGEAISGSEKKFAQRMNRTAKALGMSRTNFKNAHGLTQSGHLSTARDMTTLGRHIFYDYPEYYNLLSRQSTHAGIKTVRNTNRRLLANYRGADGIKTGYTNAAGFNLVASAERGSERIIATVFGGRSTATRNKRVAELLDMGFRKAPTRVATRKPARPVYGAVPGTGKTIRTVTTVKKSLRPQARPDAAAKPPVLLALSDEINQAVAEATSVEAPKSTTKTATKPKAKPATPKDVVLASTVAAEPSAPAAPISATLDTSEPLQEDGQEVVARLSTSGGNHWGINVGRFPSRYAAQRMLLKTALAEMNTLDGSLRKVVKRKAGYDAQFMGMPREKADLACRRLQARQVTCFMVGPG
jgi:D-alanyl-D-alanine carboxypeptidase